MSVGAGVYHLSMAANVPDDDLDDLIEAWKRGEVEVVEPSPGVRKRLMDALDAVDSDLPSIYGG